MSEEEGNNETFSHAEQQTTVMNHVDGGDWKPHYFPCEGCGKEDHTGWSDDPTEASVKYTQYCSKHCHDEVQRKEDEWWSELRGRKFEDFPDELDVHAYTEMSIWLADIWLKDEKFKQEMIEAHPLYRFPTQLAAQLRMITLDNLPREYVSFGPSTNRWSHNGTFTFNKPVPRDMALQSLRGDG